MHTVVQEPLPRDSLLATYRGGRHPELWEGYGDCFSLTLDRPVSLAAYVLAFYTSPLFRIERFILRVLAASPSSDDDLQQLMAGSRHTFAAWQVAARTETELLMQDRYGRTRSWFRVTPQSSESTLLQFGSAVAAKRKANGPARMGTSFNLLLGFHRLYSRLLLRAARKQLLRASVSAGEL